MMMLDVLTPWSADLLRMILQNELPDADLIVVSNREPYSHEEADDGVEVKAPASGMVSALEPIVRACAGTWIAHGSGSADRGAADENGRLAVPPDDPSYTLRRVWLSEEEVAGYYLGFANEGLWPLCHIAFTRPIFRAADWERYKEVNRKFADVVVDEAKTQRPLVLIQDYHFALLPRLIRERLPDAVILTFWHIPWPNSELFGVCPWREQILDGLLGSSILGFHIQLHCNNFIDAVDRYMECRVDKEEASVIYGGLTTVVRPYPISIEWPEAEDPALCDEARRRVMANLDIPPDVRLAVGVERLDYTKGIVERFHGIGVLFRQASGMDRASDLHRDRRAQPRRHRFLPAAAPRMRGLGRGHQPLAMAASIIGRSSCCSSSTTRNSCRISTARRICSWCPVCMTG
jgi:trehalose-6-phosphate synthase